MSAIETTGQFRFEMEGVMLGGTTSETYSRAEHVWHVAYEAAGQTWVGKDESLTGAYLDLIRQRLDVG